MTLAELVANLQQRAADAERVGASASLGTVYRTLLEELAELDGANGNGKHPTPPPDDRWLTAKQVAARLGCSPRYVYAGAKDFPFTMKLGKRAVRFSASGLEQWRRRR